MKKIILALTAALVVGNASYADEPLLESKVPSESAIIKSLGIGDRTHQACCRICTKGKACGNSCISVDKTCHQPPGCACNG
jgi:hypothetical protein